MIWDSSIAPSILNSPVSSSGTGILITRLTPGMSASIRMLSPPLVI